jgi:hypothetical protein
MTPPEYVARSRCLKPVIAGRKRPIIEGLPDLKFGPTDFSD